jgi:hypothetical protein
MAPTPAENEGMAPIPGTNSVNGSNSPRKKSDLDDLSLGVGERAVALRQVMRACALTFLRELELFVEFLPGIGAISSISAGVGAIFLLKINCPTKSSTYCLN